MMTKKETKKGAALKLLLAVPAIILALMIFSCQKDSEPDRDKITFIDILDRDNPLEAILKHSDLYEKRYKLLYIADGKEISASSAFSVEGVKSVVLLHGPKGEEKYGERGKNGVIELIFISPDEEKKSAVPNAIPEEEPFVIVEEMPRFQGCDLRDFHQWVGENVKYPPAAIDKGIQGTVHVTFIVETDGSVSNVKTAREVSKILDDEAVRVVSDSPSWSPGLQRGRAVRVKFMIPVSFSL